MTQITCQENNRVMFSRLMPSSSANKHTFWLYCYCAMLQRECRLYETRTGHRFLSRIFWNAFSKGSQLGVCTFALIDFKYFSHTNNTMEMRHMQVYWLFYIIKKWYICTFLSQISCKMFELFFFKILRQHGQCYVFFFSW